MGRFKMAATMFNDVIYRHGPWRNLDFTPGKINLKNAKTIAS